MEIYFTKHALERMNERGISLSEAAACVYCPDRVLKKARGTIFLKLIRGKVIILICLSKEKKYRIIAAIKSSKLINTFNF